MMHVFNQGIPNHTWAQRYDALRDRQSAHVSSPYRYGLILEAVEQTNGGDLYVREMKLHALN